MAGAIIFALTTMPALPIRLEVTQLNIQPPNHCDYHLEKQKRQVQYSFHGAQRSLDSVRIKL